MPTLGIPMKLVSILPPSLMPRTHVSLQLQHGLSTVSAAVRVSHGIMTSWSHHLDVVDARQPVLHRGPGRVPPAQALRGQLDRRLPHRGWPAVGALADLVALVEDAGLRLTESQRNAFSASHLSARGAVPATSSHGRCRCHLLQPP